MFTKKSPSCLCLLFTVIFFVSSYTNDDSLYLTRKIDYLYAKICYYTILKNLALYLENNPQQETSPLARKCLYRLKYGCSALNPAHVNGKDLQLEKCRKCIETIDKLLQKELGSKTI